MERAVKIKLGELGLNGLAGRSMGGVEQIGAQTEHAIRYYLTDRSAERPEWPYPLFLRDRGGSESAELELRIDEDVWASLEEEAGRQEVSPEQLAQHAVLYYLADREAGRVPRRIRAA